MLFGSLQGGLTGPRTGNVMDCEAHTELRLPGTDPSGPGLQLMATEDGKVEAQEGILRPSLLG